MSKTVGFIGLGNMGTAMVRGLEMFDQAEVCGTDMRTQQLEDLAQTTSLVAKGDPRGVAEASDFVILAVKPNQVGAVLENIQDLLTGDKILVSIAAGVTCAQLAELSGKRCPVVRVMPNTPALVGAGAYALCLDDPSLTKESKDFLTTMFRSIGKAFVLPESKFDAYTAVVGSGPAYVVYAMEALVDAAVYLGLTRPEATAMVESLFYGTSKLVTESDLHMTELKEMVTSPGGTTIYGLAELERNAVKAAFLEAVLSACDRSKELGN